MTSCFQDSGHDVRARRPLLSACDVIGSLYALQFLIYRTFVFVYSRLVMGLEFDPCTEWLTPS